jgi:hypothetical protein
MHASSHSRLELMPTTVSACWQDARCEHAAEQRAPKAHGPLHASRACAQRYPARALLRTHEHTHTRVGSKQRATCPRATHDLPPCAQHTSLAVRFRPSRTRQQWKTPVLSLRRIRDDSHAAMATISQDWLDVRRAAVSCRRSSPSPLPRARTPSWARGARTAGYPRTW